MTTNVSTSLQHPLFVNRIVILVILDLSAVINIHDHKILLSGLEKEFGFRVAILNWITSYLSDRKQRIKISNILSPDCQVRFGIP